VVDEGGKLNINAMYALNPRNQQEGQLPGQVLRDALMKLPNMTEEIADSILDWIDPDDDPRTSGAESSYYLSLSAPYKAKNGPLNSLDELLLVKGVTPDLLYGGDRNRNGVQDEGELDNTRGWSDYMTIYGRELNVDMSGALRFYLNAPLSDPTTMETFTNQFQPAIGDEMAMFLLAYRLYRGSATRLDANGNPTNQDPNQKPRNVQEATPDQVQAAIDRAMQVAPNGERILSITELINVRIRLPGVEGLPQDTDLVFSSPLNSKSGQEEFLPLLMVKATVQQAIEMVPRINVNTAPPEVLLGIPSITETEVAGIVTMRANQDPATQAYATGAWLVTSGAVAPDRFRRLERYITGTSMVYRVQSVGYLNRSGPVSRIEAVIDTNQGSPRFLYIRDLSDLDNPRGFQPQPPTE
jgi:DNA uptake protein ComE-like DNA-binding protein